MDSFTNSGLVRLLMRRIRAVDAALLDGIARPDPMTRGITGDADKRALVERVMRARGPGLLLSVGRALDGVDETPVTTVLTGSPSPWVLAEKWMRLERYNHATHRTDIASVGHGVWQCRRHSTGVRPSAGENALIAGALIGLLDRIGASDLHLVAGGKARPLSALHSVTLDPDEELQSFTITWRPAMRATGSGVIMQSDAVPLPDRLTDLLAGDIGRSWKLTDAARLMACSDRSLQRHLRRAGHSFSGTLRRARMREATRLLTGTDVSLAEIGYCCGYADQAHFQRDFRRVANVTPRRFRQIAGGAA